MVRKARGARESCPPVGRPGPPDRCRSKSPAERPGGRVASSPDHRPPAEANRIDAPFLHSGPGSTLHGSPARRCWMDRRTGRTGRPSSVTSRPNPRKLW